MCKGSSTIENYTYNLQFTVSPKEVFHRAMLFFLSPTFDVGKIVISPIYWQKKCLNFYLSQKGRRALEANYFFNQTKQTRNKL